MTEELKERLLKVEGGPFPEGAIGTCWQRNPDGPAAVAHIESLEAKLHTAREALTSIADADNAGGPNPYDIASEALKELSQ